MIDWHTAKPMSNLDAQLLMEHKLDLMRERVHAKRMKFVWYKYIFPLWAEETK
jgi:hypothetical protein